MKANTQYNDFIGTSAADISDHRNLNELLESKGIDIKRYDAIGAVFYSSYNEFFSASIICIDNVKSTKVNKHIIKFNLGSNFKENDFFNYFKRFEVVILENGNENINNEINEEISIDVDLDESL